MPFPLIMSFPPPPKCFYCPGCGYPFSTLDLEPKECRCRKYSISIEKLDTMVALEDFRVFREMSYAIGEDDFILHGPPWVQKEFVPSGVPFVVTNTDPYVALFKKLRRTAWERLSDPPV